MIDHDAMMAREAEQQRLVEEIIHGLNELADTFEVERRQELLTISAHYLLQKLLGDEELEFEQMIKINFGHHITKKVTTFTSRLPEQIFLFSKVLERVIASINIPLYHLYQRSLLVVEEET